MRVIKSITFICSDNVARIEEVRSAFNILIGKLTGKKPFLLNLFYEFLGVNGMTILELILKK